jgi:5-methylcytosine-specific restriction endonuclease McrA
MHYKDTRDPVCYYCGQDDPRVMFTTDHKIAKCLGGTNDADNLVCACWNCNARKGKKSLDDWRSRFPEGFHAERSQNT